jgi:hypothetical protein
MSRQRAAIRILCWTAGAALALGACKTPAPVGPVEQSRVDEILRAAATEGELSLLLDAPPQRCIDAPPTSRLCQWVLVRRHNVYEPLSDAIGSDDRLAVLCELPRDGSLRAPRSCTVHPRRSNRHAFDSGPAGPPARSGTGAPAPDELPAVSSPSPGLLASQAIASGRTLVELSRLLGEAPAFCADGADPEEQQCVWHLASQAYGHGTVAASIGAPKRARVRLTCVLPRDGSDRGADSCIAALQ